MREFTLQEFGQKVKQKYPQYKSLDDTILAQKVLDKYPQYNKIVKVEPTEEELPEIKKPITTPKKPAKEISWEVYEKPLTIDEFATRIKQRFPQYADLDNALLVEKIITRFPKYKDIVEFPKKPEIITEPLIEPSIKQRRPYEPPSPLELEESEAMERFKEGLKSVHYSPLGQSVQKYRDELISASDTKNLRIIEESWKKVAIEIGQPEEKALELKKLYEDTRMREFLFTAVAFSVPIKELVPVAGMPKWLPKKVAAGMYDIPGAYDPRMLSSVEPINFGKIVNTVKRNLLYLGNRIGIKPPPIKAGNITEINLGQDLLDIAKSKNVYEVVNKVSQSLNGIKIVEAPQSWLEKLLGVMNKGAKVEYVQTVDKVVYKIKNFTLPELAMKIGKADNIIRLGQVTPKGLLWTNIGKVGAVIGMPKEEVPIKKVTPEAKLPGVPIGKIIPEEVKQKLEQLVQPEVKPVEPTKELKEIRIIEGKEIPVFVTKPVVEEVKLEPEKAKELIEMTETEDAFLTQENIPKIMEKFGNIAVIVKDVNGLRARISISDFIKASQNPAFDERIHSVWINKNSVELNVEPKFDKEFMEAIQVGKMLKKPTISPPLQLGKLIDIEGIELTNNSTITYEGTRKFVEMITDNKVRQILKENNIKEVVIEPPYKFQLSEQANIEEDVISINADALNPTDSILHELGHQKFKSLPEIEQKALIEFAKKTTDPEMQGYKRLGRWEEIVADSLYKKPDFYKQGIEAVPTMPVKPPEMPVKEAITPITEEIPVEPVKPPIPSEIPKEVKRIKAKEEFKIGDIIDTQGYGNMVGKATINEIIGNTIKFTDSEGNYFKGIQRSFLRNLIKEGKWKKIQQPIKPPIPSEKPTEMPKELKPEVIKPKIEEPAEISAIEKIEPPEVVVSPEEKVVLNKLKAQIHILEKKYNLTPEEIEQLKIDAIGWVSVKGADKKGLVRVITELQKFGEKRRLEDYLTKKAKEIGLINKKTGKDHNFRRFIRNYFQKQPTELTTDEIRVAIAYIDKLQVNYKGIVTIPRVFKALLFPQHRPLLAKYKVGLGKYIFEPYEYLKLFDINANIKNLQDLTKLVTEKSKTPEQIIELIRQIMPLEGNDLRYLDTFGLYKEIGKPLEQAGFEYRKSVIEYSKIIDRWNEAATETPEGKELMFKAADSPFTNELREMLTPNQIKAVEEWFGWRDTFAEQFEIEKPLSNYIHHLVEETALQYVRDKYPFPEELAAVMEYVIPSQIYAGFLKERLGFPFIKRDFIAATAAYFRIAARKIAYDPALEQIKQKLNILKIGNPQLAKYIREFIQINILGRQTEQAELIANTVQGAVDKIFKEKTISLPDELIAKLKETNSDLPIEFQVPKFNITPASINRFVSNVKLANYLSVIALNLRTTFINLTQSILAISKMHLPYPQRFYMLAKTWAWAGIKIFQPSYWSKMKDQGILEEMQRIMETDNRVKQNIQHFVAGSMINMKLTEFINRVTTSKLGIEQKRILAKKGQISVYELDKLIENDPGFLKEAKLLDKEFSDVVNYLYGADYTPTVFMPPMGRIAYHLNSFSFKYGNRIVMFAKECKLGNEIKKFNIAMRKAGFTGDDFIKFVQGLPPQKRSNFIFLFIMSTLLGITLGTSTYFTLKAAGVGINPVLQSLFYLIAGEPELAWKEVLKTFIPFRSAWKRIIRISKEGISGIWSVKKVKKTNRTTR